MYSNKIRELRESRKISINELSRLSGVSAGYISSLEKGDKKNPSNKTLEKLATALGTSIEGLFNIKTDSQQVKFLSAEEAIKFILEQPTVMGRIGFDIEKLSDSEIIDFANDVLKQIELISFKYNK